MNRSVQNQEVRIRQVQALVFEGIGSESWATGDDSTVRADLENLHGRLKCWAKKHAIEDMSQVRELAPEEYGPLIQVLAQVVQLHSGTPNVIEHLESTPMINKKSPAMCIQGLLAHHVYTKIISRPFFVFRDGGDLFQGLFEQIRQGKRSISWQSTLVIDENEAHILRSRTLRLLATPPPNRAQGNGTYCYTTNQKAVCHELAGEFYESPVRHLIKPPSREGENAATQCLDDLASIFQYAGELSYKLWTRRTTLEISTLRDLRGVPFRMDIEYMKAHPLHRLYEDDDRCDGWFASVVAHPAVVGYGSSDGKDYTTPRVWMKAEVWLAEDAAAAFGAAVEGEV
ncbi:hypothetical protein C7999DRAFT_10405 [Corynascus novoguineensis]|uniref:Uncharacterized protein n=1 Tax=Corynascus novoguineensis TaxID=1126955 RepID=A0AAN7D1V8_9PEZI|nr:hypothetical protein C7999DRAFT_10405 [Corynascus novoguineensis]